MFKQPTEKRKNAVTSVNLPTWWERTAAPMLNGAGDPTQSELSCDEHGKKEGGK